MPASLVRIGTRNSPLARWQAHWVAEQLTSAGVTVELVPIFTQGDQEQSATIGTLGRTGVFTKEIQFALLQGRVDVAVHSLKDLPTEVTDGLALAAVPPRAPHWDVLVSRGGVLLADLPAGARVGTGSRRRQAQLLHLRPDLVLSEIRGNVDTRLAKLDRGDYDAIVLAQAGLSRLGLGERVTEPLGERLLPAAGQGALGIEARADDLPTLELLRTLDHEHSRRAVLAERAVLARLHAGCMAPVGAWGRVEAGVLQLDATVVSLDGRIKLVARASAELGEAVSLGQRVAEKLLSDGADRILADSRGYR